MRIRHHPARLSGSSPSRPSRPARVSLRIAYIFDNRVPSAQADTEQLVNTVAALSRVDGVDIRLVVPRLPGTDDPHREDRDGAPDARWIRDFYHVRGAFGVDRFPTPTRPRILQKLWAGARVALGSTVDPDELVYTRNLPVAMAAVAAGYRTCLDTYRPWPDQVPVLVPVLGRMGRRPAFAGAVLHSALARASYLACGIPPERLLTAHNGFDPVRLEPRLTRREARERLGLRPGIPLVVYTGRIAAEKGVDVLLDMARHDPDIHYALVGGRGGDRLEREADALPNVAVHPWCSTREVAPWLYAADVLVSPPSARPLRRGNTVLPMKLFSYLGAGRPVLAGRTRDMEGLLTDGENASLAQPGSLADALQRIRRILRDGAHRSRLERGARESARHLTWDARATRVTSFLRARLARA